MAALRLTFQRIWLLLVVNVLWWLFTLPLLTWPPATAAMFHVVRRLTDQEEADYTTWRHFFEGFRRYGWQSWQLMAINLLAGFIFLVAFRFYWLQAEPLFRIIAVSIFCLILLWVSLQLYLFPLLIEQNDKQIRLIFKNAYLLVLKNLTFTVAFGLLLLSVILLLSTLTGPLLLIVISFLAVAQTLALQRLLGLNQPLEKEV